MGLHYLTPLKNAGWTPLKLANLDKWYSAKRSTITKDGFNAVSQWNDLSPNGKHLVQVTASAQPTYEATGLNSKPTVYSVGDWMVYAGNTATKNTAFSVWMVIKTYVSRNYGVIWHAPDTNNFGTTGNVFAEVRNGDTSAMDLWSNNIGPSASSGANSFVAPNNVYRLLTTYDGSTVRQYINGVEVITQTSATGRFIGDSFTFPTFRYAGYTAYDTDCRISDVVVMNGVATADERAALETWYTNEWA